MSPRMVFWSVFLLAYNYALSYHPGMDLDHANTLSHLPLPTPVTDPSPMVMEDLPWLLLHASDMATSAGQRLHSVQSSEPGVEGVASTPYRCQIPVLQFLPIRSLKEFFPLVNTGMISKAQLRAMVWGQLRAGLPILWIGAAKPVPVPCRVLGHILMNIVSITETFTCILTALILFLPPPQ